MQLKKPYINLLGLTDEESSKVLQMLLDKIIFQDIPWMLRQRGKDPGWQFAPDKERIFIEFGSLALPECCASCLSPSDQANYYFY